MLQEEKVKKELFLIFLYLKVSVTGWERTPCNWYNLR